ncbi:MAG TPA: Rrf2 family transcriptional regulator [Sphingobium sp.]|nr:Rrf2 family transcriptional regulator [Sphingobium sp.]
MRLTNFSDYALRLLMFAASHEQRLVTIEETSRVFGISRGHLMKVANQLTRAGYLKAVRGRSGGLSLARPAGDIRLGEVLGVTEPDFVLAECFGGDNCCLITPRCRLRTALGEALSAFIGTLNRYTVADLVLRPEDFGLARVAKGAPGSAGTAVLDPAT